eukprot:COSAG06_NODE_16140_length_1019_cov_2.501087_2_plen_33_part_01
MSAQNGATTQFESQALHSYKFAGAGTGRRSRAQ